MKARYPFSDMVKLALAHMPTPKYIRLGAGDDLRLKIEPVGRDCPRCQKPIMVVHGQTPLLLLSCDCRGEIRPPLRHRYHRRLAQGAQTKERPVFR